MGSMRSAPGSHLLPESERLLFIEQFEKDIRFYQLFFLLISRSLPIRNVDLVWVEDGRLEPGRHHLGIAEALGSSSSRLLGLPNQNPHPAFCNVINQDGCQEAQSCGVSDKAAEERVGRTGKSEVYRCHFGLIDIAVPVLMKSHHIATLFTGQVLREPPSRDGFVQIAKDAAPLTYIDLKQLERAYWEVAVVREEDIEYSRQVLEAFAEYLSNSWLRLTEAIKERRSEDRELQLSRKEFAYYALESADGGAVPRHDLKALARKIGFTKVPNRVLVAQLGTQDEFEPPAVPFDLSFATALTAVEEVCEELDNVVSVHLRKAEICVLFHDPECGQGRSAEFFAHRLANRILCAIYDRGGLRARIGIGTAKNEWRCLTDCYREASTALAGSTATVATYRKPTGSFADLSAHVEALNKLLVERKLPEAQAAIAALPVLASRCLTSEPGYLNAVSLFFSATLESLCFTARNMGCDADIVAMIDSTFGSSVERVSSFFQLRESWLRSAGGIVKEIGRLYSSKRGKIAERACRMIDQSIERNAAPQQLSISYVASALGVSVSHFSRTFKRETGQTFEHYVSEKRVEHAQRLLLDPLNNVSEVARKCGFEDVSYFARVFRRVAGCSPSEYSQAPMRVGPAA